MCIKNANSILSSLTKHKIIPVIRSDSSNSAYKAVKTLKNVGYHTAEITLTIPGALKIIKELSKYDDILIGAGTVLNANDAQKCIQAGAQYIVSPIIVDDISQLCSDAGIPFFMSGLTPTEIYKSWELGSSAVKIFPVNSMGGANYLSSLKTVFPDIPLMPTGGVNLSNIKEYLESGASFVGVGGELVNKKMLDEDNFEGIAENGRKFLIEVNKTKKGGKNNDLF